VAIFDAKGRLWHLQFGLHPAPVFLKRLKKKDFPWIIPPELLFSLKEALCQYFEQQAPFVSFPYFLLATSFERKVLQVVRQIPYGQVRTYRWVAQQLGQPGAVRAVGQALARNPLPLLFPCHRVIGKKDLGGFSAGILLKKRLLRGEGLLFDS